MKLQIFQLLFFFFTLQLQAQTLVGTVKDQNQQPLENTNVMAKPLGGKKGMKFAIADHLGRYKLELEKETDYEITVNYIGFLGEKITYLSQNPITTYDFVLEQQETQLEEIVIEYDYQPVIVKKDTLIFDVAAFANGNERKLKEQLEKLPGVEVSENGQVKVQGKTVTQFMVEGKSFFGGGTKIGVENIPADAVDKVEVIDHFTEVAHMKEVSGSDDLAMNIKLKEDKKQFVFGDLRAGYGNNKYYETHAALFYYAPKINWSAILNVNNYGGQVLDYGDIARFEGFKSAYLKNSNSLINFI
ncbi:carboxypeptidase regulatory-like domain-containing protein [Flavobacterium sp. I3-2]|uniref:carboxypeptidase regulatory-like domain-containing protein n=1 Tax=Flavobacterium sp. I3-2 TaxID=2748319 RepID=UPI0015ACA91D|nr:carboxypeptidase-like regulatory domain-containing protein [Flavobacterium sp. I3-2]